MDLESHYGGWHVVPPPDALWQGGQGVHVPSALVLLPLSQAMVLLQLLPSVLGT